LYPITGDALAFQERTTSCETVCKPLPVRDTAVGELVALLVMVTLPVTPVVVEGVNVTLSDALCPGARICPVDTPLAPNPAPAMLTLEMVTLAVPELVTVAGTVDFAPMVTVPKAKLEGFTVRLAVGAALTVRVALALVTLPAELVTIALKRAPLSEVVVAGVV
jgi:hypothetical protein